ncbi:MAG: FtsW/RodA/SpoVE family cell cycle protein [Actinomycetia bacterium]|nr:FtsW/RodA/SpoVE family cell cycle protein [Actinomycetes bacterium]
MKQTVLGEACSSARWQGFVARILGHYKPAQMLIVVVAVLVAFGLVMGFSASFVQNSDGTKFLVSQAIYMAAGLLAMFLIILVGGWVFRNHRLAWLVVVAGLWLGSLVLMVLVQTSLGVEVNGAQRWLDLPGLPLFQPSEFAKIAVILFSAALMERIRDNDECWAIWALFISNAAILLLAIMQNDMGSTLLIYIGLLAVLWFGDLQIFATGWRFFASISCYVLLAVLACLASLLLPGFRQARWAAFWAPMSQVSDLPYQIKNGFYALGDGGLTGLGLGLSKQKYFYLPFASSDSIFPVVGEELGLIGAVAVILLFLLLAFYGLRVAKQAGSTGGQMLAGAATTLIVMQALINIASVTGAGPMTGKTLPFFSTGGSSMIVTLILVGCMLLVAFFDPEEQRHIARRDALRLVPGGSGGGVSPSLAARPRAGKAVPTSALANAPRPAAPRLRVVRGSRQVVGAGVSIVSSREMPAMKKKGKPTAATAASTTAHSRNASEKGFWPLPGRKSFPVAEDRTASAAANRRLARAVAESGPRPPRPAASHIASRPGGSRCQVNGRSVSARSHGTSNRHQPVSYAATSRTHASTGRLQPASVCRPLSAGSWRTGSGASPRLRAATSSYMRSGQSASNGQRLRDY